MGWLPRGVTGLVPSVVLAAAGCSIFPASPPEVTPSTGGRDGGVAGGKASGGASNGGASNGGASNGGASDSGAGGGGAGGETADAAPDARASGNGGRHDAGTSNRDAGTIERRYTAVSADCLEKTTGATPPDPDACLAYATGKDGPNEVWVDLKKSPHRQFTGYLRFDLDAAFAGRSVLAARVEITVTAYATAAGNAPQLWECAPFSRASLFVQMPAIIGTTALAPSPGVVAVAQTVSYSLPTSLVTPSASAYLALVPVLAKGSGYGNTSSTAPPRLVVSYR